MSPQSRTSLAIGFIFIVSFMLAAADPACNEATPKTEAKTMSAESASFTISEGDNFRQALNKARNGCRVPIMVEDSLRGDAKDNLGLDALRPESLEVKDMKLKAALDAFKKACADKFTWTIESDAVVVSAIGLPADRVLQKEVEHFEFRGCPVMLLGRIFREVDKRLVPVTSFFPGPEHEYMDEARGLVTVEKGTVRQILTLYCRSVDLCWSSETLADGRTFVNFHVLPPKAEELRSKATNNLSADGALQKP